MNRKWLIIILVFTSAAAVVYALSGGPHEFAEGECAICHYDVLNKPDSIKPAVTLACNICHSKVREKKSHPVDINPTFSIPADMPLVDGRLTCITCHYVHPKENMDFMDSNYFLRRLTKGMYFCIICHEVDKDKHIVTGNIHPGTYRVRDYNTRIDSMSLTCIECHDSYMDSPVNFLGSGTWNHYSKEFNHPIGLEYDSISARDIRNYQPSSMLSEDMKLYDGKIGCGTCHNIYSTEENMLVMDNIRSRLCFECHIK